MRFLRDTKAASHYVEIIIVLLVVVVAGIGIWKAFGDKIQATLTSLMEGW